MDEIGWEATIIQKESVQIRTYTTTQSKQTYYVELIMVNYWWKSKNELKSLVDLKSEFLLYYVYQKQ
jgi:hypothetical protein